MTLPHPVRVAVALLAGGGLAATLAGAPVEAADPRADQERIKTEVAAAAAAAEHATDRAREAAARYAAAEAALPAARAAVADARGELAAARAYVDSTSRQVRQAEQGLRVAASEVASANDAVEQSRENVSSLAAAAYRGGRAAGFRLLLRADSPAEAGQRLGYLDHVSRQERAALDEFSGARLRARQAENEASRALARAETAHREAGIALAAAQAAEAAAEAAAAEADALVAQRAEALRVAAAEREASLARHREVEKEAERIAAEVRQWQEEQSGSAIPADDAGAVLGMPTQGWLSSPYGMRQDPFYGTLRMHAGMDLAAAGGAPIRAAAGGTVIRAGWSGGYGNLTCLSHGTHQGQGLSTCYAHQSEILVSTGQQVQRGELIGRVGTTGSSTGNHLHFEVRLDGTPTDPVPYLPDCLC